eukprot:2169944-Rhodomonas_salina.1
MQVAVFRETCCAEIRFDVAARSGCADIQSRAAAISGVLSAICSSISATCRDGADFFLAQSCGMRWRRCGCRALRS